MSACGTDVSNALGDGGVLDKAKDTVGAVAGEIAKACGLGCPGDDVGGVKVRGIEDGNASISGVAQVDSFFESVLNYRNAVTNVNAGMEAQLAAIRADFGMATDADVATELDAQLTSYVEGTVHIEAEPARCEVDAKATVEAAARCDTTIEPGTAMVECKGACEVDAQASVQCDANADLVCNVTGPAVQCSGMCQGSCEAQLSAATKCSGVCHGTCSGSCSAYADAAGTQCAGECSGECVGSCETQVMAGASCTGMCRGSCTVQNPQGGCQANAHAECRGKASASVMCRGKCTGDFEPPKVKAECQASAKCEASLNVQCTPPRLVVAYKLKAGVDAAAQARFGAALENLHKVRLPALLQAAAKADFVARAGENLVVSADSAVKTSVNAAIKGDLSVRAGFGLACAVKELPKVQKTLDEPNQRLNDNIMTCQHLKGVLGMTG
jgi:hypothetical protein